MIDESAAQPPTFLGRVLGALTLQESTFRAAAEDENPVRNGLIFLLMIGVAVAVATLIGATLYAWTSPSMDAIRDAILGGLRNMPWSQDLPPAAEAQVQEMFDLFSSYSFAFGPSIGTAAGGLIATPVSLILGWLLFGLLAHLFARMLSGTASLGQTYGALSVAYAPLLLGVVQVVPRVQAAGIGLWVLICTFVALKTVHGLSSGRAFWTIVLTYVALIAISLVISACLIAILFVTVGPAIEQFLGGMA